MKPRFSILTLLGITAYVALNVAAFRSRLTCNIAQCVWWVLVFYTLIVAVGRTTTRTVFARAFLASMLIAFGAIAFEFWPFVIELIADIAETLAEPDPTMGKSFLFACNVCLGFGLLCGSLAIWNYRRQERRANQEKSE